MNEASSARSTSPDVGVDHRGLALRHGEPRLDGIDSELPRGRIDRGLETSRRTRRSRRPRARGGGEASRGDSGRPWRSTGRLAARAQPPIGQAHEDQRRRDGERAHPVERRQRLAIDEPADQRRNRRLGEKVSPTTSGDKVADGIDEQALAEDLAASAKMRTKVQSAGMTCSPSTSDREAASPRQKRSREQQRKRLSRTAGALERRSGSRRKEAGDEREQVAREIVRAEFAAPAHQQRRAPAARPSARLCSADGARRASHRPHIAKTGSTCSRTGSRCRAWSSGCRRSRRRDRREEEAGEQR